MILELETPIDTEPQPRTIAPQAHEPPPRKEFIQKFLDHANDRPQAAYKKKEEDPFEIWFNSECDHDVVLRYHKKKFREAFNYLLEKQE